MSSVAVRKSGPSLCPRVHDVVSGGNQGRRDVMCCCSTFNHQVICFADSLLECLCCIVGACNPRCCKCS